jgi:hypothetical protein
MIATCLIKYSVLICHNLWMLSKGRSILLFECRVLQSKSRNLEAHKETFNSWSLIDPVTTISVFYFSIIPQLI